jgi:RNA polymerase sigma-70 factor (ECF subfamily)
VANDSNQPQNQDAELVQRANAGDLMAFERLVEKYDRPLRTFIKSRGIDETSALDVAQKVWIRAFRKLKTIRQPASFRSWLFRMAVFATKTEFRERTRHQSHGVGRGGAALHNARDTLIDPADGPEQIAQQKEDVERIYLVLQRMPVQHRQIMTLHFLAFCNDKEIAYILELPVGTVKSKKHKANAIFRRKWKAMSRVVVR